MILKPTIHSKFEHNKWLTQRRHTSIESTIWTIHVDDAQSIDCWMKRFIRLAELPLMAKYGDENCNFRIQCWIIRMASQLAITMRRPFVSSRTDGNGDADAHTHRTRGCWQSLLFPPLPSDWDIYRLTMRGLQSYRSPFRMNQWQHRNTICHRHLVSPHLSPISISAKCFRRKNRIIIFLSDSPSVTYRMSTIKICKRDKVNDFSMPVSEHSDTESRKSHDYQFEWQTNVQQNSGVFFLLFSHPW